MLRALAESIKPSSPSDGREGEVEELDSGSDDSGSVLLKDDTPSASLLWPENRDTQRMKKTGLRVLTVAFGLFVLVVFMAMFFIDSIVKKGVETVGPKVAKVDMKLEGASLSMVSGRGSLKGLVVGNPEGFKTPNAVKVGEVVVVIDAMTLMKDKIVVRSVNVVAPEITFEGGLKGNNLSKILENVQAFTASDKGAAKEGASKKIQVDELVISDGKVNLSITLLGGKSATVPLPTIRLTDLGKGGDGMTPGELSEKIITAVLEGATGVAGEALGKLGKEVAGAAKDLGQGTKGQADKLTKGIGGLFKK